jgi:hypothetical protein
VEFGRWHLLDDVVVCLTLEMQVENGSNLMSSIVSILGWML